MAARHTSSDTEIATSRCLITTNLQDIDVESLMQEIKQWNPPEQAASASHAQLPADTHAPATVDASPRVEGSGLLPVASPAPSSSPDRTQSHAAASSSGSSHRVCGLFSKSSLELVVLVPHYCSLHSCLSWDCADSSVTSASTVAVSTCAVISLCEWYAV